MSLIIDDINVQLATLQTDVAAIDATTIMKLANDASTTITVGDI